MTTTHRGPVDLYIDIPCLFSKNIDEKKACSFHTKGGSCYLAFASRLVRKNNGTFQQSVRDIPPGCPLPEEAKGREDILAEDILDLRTYDNPEKPFDGDEEETKVFNAEDLHPIRDRRHYL